MSDQEVQYPSSGRDNQEDTEMGNASPPAPTSPRHPDLPTKNPNPLFVKPTTASSQTLNKASSQYVKRDRRVNEEDFQPSSNPTSPDAIEYVLAL